jgi:hypothetical protein
MILRLNALRRPAVVIALFAGLTHFGARALDAHEIPARAALIAFVKPEPGTLRIVLRAPLESMRDVNWPEKGLGYMDLPKSAPLARDAANLWIVDFIQLYENGAALAGGKLVATRISLPSEKTFTSYESALAATTGASLPASTDIPHANALIDVVIDYPISSERSAFSIQPTLARLGLQVTTVLRYLTPDGAERVYQYRGDPGLVHLDPAWYHAAWQFVKLGIQHIISGIDHLLFVLCLVIPFRRLKPLIVIVTAFTVAHSITLASAALGVVPDALWFPPLIEVLIAGSILYMALENIVGANLRRRWLIGFSFALKESLQFAGKHLAVSLLTFNIGVEIGQVLVLALAIPLLSFVFTRVVAERLGIIILSAFIAHTAWHWMTERAGTLSEYTFTMPAMDTSFAVSAMRAAIVLLIAGAAAWLLSEGVRRFAPPDPSVASKSE